MIPRRPISNVFRLSVNLLRYHASWNLACDSFDIILFFLAEIILEFTFKFQISGHHLLASIHFQDKGLLRTDRIHGIPALPA